MNQTLFGFQLPYHPRHEYGRVAKTRRDEAHYPSAEQVCLPCLANENYISEFRFFFPIR